MAVLWETRCVEKLLGLFAATETGAGQGFLEIGIAAQPLTDEAGGGFLGGVEANLVATLSARREDREANLGGVRGAMLAMPYPVGAGCGDGLSRAVHHVWVEIALRPSEARVRYRGAGECVELSARCHEGIGTATCGGTVTQL